MPNDTGKQQWPVCYILRSRRNRIMIIFRMQTLLGLLNSHRQGYSLELDMICWKRRHRSCKYMEGPVAASTLKGKSGQPKIHRCWYALLQNRYLENPPKTHDELIEMAKATKGKNGTQFGFATPWPASTKVWGPYALEYIGAAYGGSVVWRRRKHNHQQPRDNSKGLRNLLKSFVLILDLTT